MAHFDPVYGEVLNSREVSEMTGLTINQLRNMRQRKADNSLPYLRAGNTSWYRKQDVLNWVQSNGVAEAEYIIPNGIEPAPLVGSPIDSAKRDVLAKIANITTKNSWSKWYTWILEDSGVGYSKAFYRIEELQKEFYKKINDGEDLDDLYPDVLKFGMMRKNDPHRFWPAFTYAIRQMMAEISDWDVTEQEILAPPIGDVPPTKLEGK